MFSRDSKFFNSVMSGAIYTIGFILVTIGMFMLINKSWEIVDTLIYGELRPNGLDAIFSRYLTLITSVNYFLGSRVGLLWVSVDDNINYQYSFIASYIMMCVFWFAMSLIFVSDTNLPDKTDTVMILSVIGINIYSYY